jgi:hypothetical protein
MKNIDMNVGKLAGRFKIEAARLAKDGSEIAGSRRVLADWFDNLVTNNGLDLFASGNYLLYCQVGTGSTTPANGNTALVSRVAASNTQEATSEGAQASAPYFCWRQKTFRFAEGVAAGNLAEVGVGASSTANLFSRALILDNMGSPTTITVLSDEVLDVTYELRVYAPEDDWTGTVTLDSVDYDVVGRAAGVTNNAYWTIGADGAANLASNAFAYNGAIGAIDSVPAGTASAASSISTDSYSAASLLRDATPNWGLSSGNLAGGITAMRVTFGVGTYQFSFDPAIPKDNTQVLALTVRNAWARKTL